VYYKYVPPIVYYNTSNPYATTYYANGYEYVPNYIAPVVYYAPTYGYYGGGTSYSRGYGYSSGGGYSSSGAYYPNYVPQSAYYSKEAQLVNEDNHYGGGSSGNWLADEGRDQDIGAGVEKFTNWSLMLDDNPFVGPAVTFGTELAEGKGLEDATGKSSFGLGLSLLSFGVMTIAPESLLLVGAVYVAATLLSIGFDWLYDHRHLLRGICYILILKFLYQILPLNV